jgi:hypothetical protein
VETRITATCPCCGTVVLSPDDLRLVRDPFQRVAWYVWDCSGCATQVRKEAAFQVWQALSRVGVTAWQIPAEVMERSAELKDRDPLPVQPDEVLDALLFMRTRSYLAALAADGGLRRGEGQGGVG